MRMSGQGKKSSKRLTENLRNTTTEWMHDGNAECSNGATVGMYEQRKKVIGAKKYRILRVGATEVKLSRSHMREESNTQQGSFPLNTLAGCNQHPSLSTLALDGDRGFSMIAIARTSWNPPLGHCSSVAMMADSSAHPAEPVFTHICSSLGLDTFTLRQTESEYRWLLHCTVHNLLKVHRYGYGRT